MSWIRLDDQIAHHPKVTQVSPTACWLWVTAIGHAQKFLTDGFIRSTSIRALSHIELPEPYIQELVSAGLMDAVDGGFQIHDYLDFNASSNAVKAKRAADRVRKESTRNPRGIRTESARNPRSVLARAPASHPIPSKEDQLKNIDKQQQQRGNGNGHAMHAAAAPAPKPKKQKPQFDGRALTLHRWQVNECIKALGKFIDKFDLDAWFWRKDAAMFSKGLVMPEEDVMAWIRAELIADAQREGLPIAFATIPKATEPIYREWQCPHTPPCPKNAPKHRCDQRSIIGDKAIAEYRR